MTAKAILKRALRNLGVLDYLNKRVWLARRHLSGRGLEIGAMHRPLKVPGRAKVEYVDIASREESIRKFPELDPRDIVEVDFIADGFTLAGLPDAQFDFLIANHVLEHSPDPIGTLVRWSEVLKEQGVIFCTLPLADKCFDKGRTITTYEHMVEDYDLRAAGDAAAMKERNREHYLEWLRISEPNILKRPPLDDAVLAQKAVAMAEEASEIHFHTFSAASVEDLFRRLERERFPWLKLVEIAVARDEVIAILKKDAGGSPDRGARYGRGRR